MKEKWGLCKAGRNVYRHGPKRCLFGLPVVKLNGWLHVLLQFFFVPHMQRCLKYIGEKFCGNKSKILSDPAMLPSIVHLQDVWCILQCRENSLKTPPQDIVIASFRFPSVTLAGFPLEQFSFSFLKLRCCVNAAATIKEILGLDKAMRRMMDSLEQKDPSYSVSPKHSVKMVDKSGAEE